MRVIIDVSTDTENSRTVVLTREKDGGDEEIGRFPVQVVQVGELSLPVCTTNNAGSVVPVEVVPVEQVAAVMKRIEVDGLEDGDVTVIGRHLFQVLLGTHWTALTDDLAKGEPLLLGLRWPSADAVFNSLPWEAMHDGQRFLATRTGNLVATTRIVAGSTAVPGKVDEVPRILFAVGSRLDDKDIRPGAELMGLLRDFERGRRDESTGEEIGWVETRTIASVSLSLLAETARSFRPHCVHIVAHGDRDSGSGEEGVKLYDEVQTAHKLALALRWTDDAGVERNPDLVVISACETGGGAAVAGTSISVPMAARLVDEGIPIVVGMAGEVGDMACRLFTKGFGDSLLKGEDVAASGAHGRRAAYIGSGPPTKTIDWALPTVFFSAEVPLNHVAIASPDKLRMIRTIAQELGMVVDRTEPVFCGREEFFGILDDLLDRRSRVLVAWGRSLAGVGEKRLCKELGRRSIHRGHLPIDLEDNHDQQPKTTSALVVDIVRSMFIAARDLELPAFGSVVLTKLGFPPPDDPDWGTLIWQTREAREKASNIQEKDDDAAALRSWLAADFEALMERAREKMPEVFTASSSAILMMHRVHVMVDTLDSLFEEKRLLGHYGLGSKGNPVPVIMTASLEGAAGAKIDDAKNHRPSGWRYEELQPFRRDNVLIVPFYLWVLMNPRPGMFKTPSGFLGANVYAPLRYQDGWREKMQGRFEGLTDDFGWPLMDMANWLSSENADGGRQFEVGNDEQAFAEYLKTEKQ